MSSYVTLTLNTNTFREVMDNLQEAYKLKESYWELEDLVHLVDLLEEEEREYWAKENREWKRWVEIEKMMSEEKTPSNIFLFQKIRSLLKEYDIELFEKREYHLVMDILDLLEDSDESTDNE